MKHQTLLSAILVTGAIGCSGAAWAQTAEVRISKGYGIQYLPMMIMEEQKLLEKQARAAGAGEIRVTWPTLDGGNVINDAMLSGALDIASIGVPGFATLWGKTQANPRLKVMAVSGVSTGTVYLNTRNPAIRTLRDFGPNDRIAVPGIKTSAVAMILQMAAAKEWGPEHYARLDTLTVGLPHPEAVQFLLSGKGEINSHFASQPFAAIELRDPKIHTVIDSNQVFGGPATVIMSYSTSRFRDANPKLLVAFIAALEEANAVIDKDRRAAAEIYVRLSGSRAGVEDAMTSLNDPGTQFTTKPEGVMKYFEFMHRVGLLTTLPASWKDVFFPEIHHLPGS